MKDKNVLLNGKYLYKGKEVEVIVSKKDYTSGKLSYRIQCASTPAYNNALVPADELSEISSNTENVEKLKLKELVESYTVLFKRKPPKERTNDMIWLKEKVESMASEVSQKQNQKQLISDLSDEELRIFAEEKKLEVSGIMDGLTKTELLSEILAELNLE